MSEKTRYDVVVIDRATKTIEAIVGTNLPSLDDPGCGSNSAEGRLSTVLGRINTADYDAEMVKAGKYKQGDKLPTTAAN